MINKIKSTTMKSYKVIIEGDAYQLSINEMETLLNEKSFKLAKKVARQGGEIKLRITAIKEEILNRLAQ